MTTVVMAFRNEGIQVGKTIDSLYQSLSPRDHIEVICINDCSDDKYDYETELKDKTKQYKDRIEIHYAVNEGRLGSSMSKELGVQAAPDGNILLVDAHMRFIDSDWLNVVNNCLHNDSKAIYCLKTVGFNPDTEEIKNHRHSGAYLVPMHEKIFKSEWSKQINAVNSVMPIAVIMGASYFFTKDYWNKLKGLQGLRLWGREEEYLSIKSWSYGGSCFIVPDCEIAHMYRKVAPTTITQSEVWYNIQVILRTLELKCFEDVSNLMYEKNPSVCLKVAKQLEDHKDELIRLRDYYRSLNLNQKLFWGINDYMIRINK